MAAAGRNRNFRHQRLSRDRASWARAALAGCAAVAAAASTAAPAAAASTAAPAAAASPAAAAHPQAVRTLVVRTLVVQNLSDAGPGSLSAAITTANTRPASRIVFSVRGTIRLARALPAIHRRVAIDATSAPGYHGGGPPVVAINCRHHLGLVFGPGAGGSSLLGVAVDRAGDAGVTLVARNITLNHDYIGLNLQGHPAGNHGNGVLVASDGNRIGTNRAGTRALGNRGDGIDLIGGAADNEIGGTAYVNPATGQANDPTGDKGTVTPVFVVPPLGNTISGNKGKAC